MITGKQHGFERLSKAFGRRASKVNIVVRFLGARGTVVRSGGSDDGGCGGMDQISIADRTEKEIPSQW